MHQISTSPPSHAASTSDENAHAPRHADVDEVCALHVEVAERAELRDVRAGRLEAGTVSGQRYRWLGLRGGESRIEIEALWTLGGFYPESWPKPRDGWTVSIEGDPSFRTHFTSLARSSRTRSQGATRTRGS